MFEFYKWFMLFQVIIVLSILNEETSNYIIPEDLVDTANQEFLDLLNMAQDIEIRKFSIEDLGTTQFTPSQMQAIMFMVEG